MFCTCRRNDALGLIVVEPSRSGLALWIQHGQIEKVIAISVEDIGRQSDLQLVAGTELGIDRFRHSVPLLISPEGLEDGCDIDGDSLDAESLRLLGGEFGALRARFFVREQQGEHVVLPDGPDGKGGAQGRIDSPAEPDDETFPMHRSRLFSDELTDPRGLRSAVDIEHIL